MDAEGRVQALNILKIFKIRTRLLMIIFGCSFALVCLGAASVFYELKLRAANLEASQAIYHEALVVTLALLAFFIVCGAGLGVIIGLSINSSVQEITRRTGKAAMSWS